MRRSRREVGGRVSPRARPSIVVGEIVPLRAVVVRRESAASVVVGGSVALTAAVGGASVEGGARAAETEALISDN